MTVAEAAEKYRRLNNPGSYVGPWTNEMTPYLVEPMNELQSLDFTSVIFAGPAQCGKTEIINNWVGYSAKCDPADMMIVQTSNITARDFSIRRIDRLHRHSPDIGEMLIGGKHGDNTFDKHYRSGMMLSLSWPAINELSGKPIPRQAITDLDRMPEDIDGEGNVVALTQKRGTTYGRHAMTLAESSPGFTVDNPKWVRKSKHEAPPTKGILAWFNKGDRRLWYWDCVYCHQKFEPSFDLLQYPDSEDFMEAAEQTVLVCPHCAGKYHHDPSDHGPGKHEMNNSARWIKDGQTWQRDGSITGVAARSSSASFWLKGVAAAFSDWPTLVHRTLTAEAEYDSHGGEESLKTTVNTDRGEAYTPKSHANDRVPEQIMATAREYGQKVVPEGVRFLVASVDVQKNRFVVQVHGICTDGLALNKDIYVIDRFEIKYSKRPDPEREGQFQWVNPGAYPEDWKLLGEELILKSYPLSDDSGRRMGVKMTVCDSGGKAGVTTNAYDFVRWLRKGDEDFGEYELENAPADVGTYKWEPNMAARFLLVKGASAKNAPRIALSYPDSQRKDRNAGARGEIPVLMMNTNTLKDMVDHRLDRVATGGRFCFPAWLPQTFYIELTVEHKDPNKGWLNPKQYRNESWDLLAYCMAAILTPTIALDHMDPTELPSWAEAWDKNDLVFDPETKATPFEAEKKRKSLAEIGRNLA